MDINTRRLGIFCYYDAEGVVDTYLEYLLKDLKQNLTKLIIVVNGFVNDEGKRIFEKYAKEIVIRENRGFDVGAFRDVLIYSIGKDGMGDWDEIVFCNDTFYGPLIPFDTIFSSMEQKKADFWGINLVEDGMFTHIQSFFLVFRNRIVSEEALFQYFDIQPVSMMLLTSNISDIYAAYELGLFRFLTHKGYTFAAYTNTQSYDVYQSPDVCIKKYGLPLLKKKCFSDNFFRESVMVNALSYINEKLTYDIANIRQNVLRQYTFHSNVFFKIRRDVDNDYIYMSEKPTLIEEKKVVDFIEHNPNIYIYGTGVYARKIWYLFHDKMTCFKGFIISDDIKISESILYSSPVFHYSDMRSDGAIIIGCDAAHTREILLNINHYEKICVLWERLGEEIAECIREK